jgi:hypothetical protein
LWSLSRSMLRRMSGYGHLTTSSDPTILSVALTVLGIPRYAGQ